MVVNRKQPTIPTAPISRTSSTQPIPTRRTVAKSTTVRHETQNPATVVSKAQKKLKTQTKRRRPRSLLDQLFLLSLFLFASYSYLLCKTSLLGPPESPEPLLCRSLVAYRTRVLEPYVLPPITRSISYTQNLAQPYIELGKLHAEPYVAPVRQAVGTIEPYATSAQQSVQRLWKHNLLPFYKGTLQPWWFSSIVPRWNRHIQPRLIPLQQTIAHHWRYYISKPLQLQHASTRRRLDALYLKHVEPLAVTIRPYVVRSTTELHNRYQAVSSFAQQHIVPRLRSAWITGKPYVVLTLKEGRKFGCQAFKLVSSQVRAILQTLGHHRRTYVDPHVTQIWAKVTEKSAPGTPPPTVESVDEPTSAKLSTSLPLPTISAETVDIPPVVPAPASPEEAPQEAEETLVEESIVGEETDSPSKKEQFASTVKPTPSISSTANSVAETLADRQSTPSATPSSAKTEDPEPISMKFVEENDLEDFLKEMGLATPDETEPAEPTPEEVPIQDEVAPVEDQPVTLSEEELAEKRAKTAKQRREIQTRHRNWQVRLDDLYLEEGPRLAETLKKTRDAASEDLQRVGWGTADKSTVGLLDAIEEEGHRLLKGLDAYLKKSDEKSNQWKYVDNDSDKPAKLAKSKDEKERWATVVSKVDEKFKYKVEESQRELGGWMNKFVLGEMELLETSAEKLRQLAEEAQADLKMDYAWLEDVTWEDWEQYNNLMKTHTAFVELAETIQNGTSGSPPAPPNPIDNVLGAFNDELQDMILGFGSALSEVKSRAIAIFSVYQIPDDEEDSGFFVVRDGEVRRDDLRGVDLNNIGVKKGVVKKGDKEEEVHILPIHDEAGEKQDASQVLLGKSPEQIAQALSGAPHVEVRHEEL